MECLLTLAMRLWHRAHKLLLIRAYDLRVRENIVQRPPDQALSRLLTVDTQLLSGSRVCCLGKTICNSPDDRLGDCLAARRASDSIAILGDNTKVELSLGLLWYGETQYMLCSRYSYQKQLPKRDMASDCKCALTYL